MTRLLFIRHGQSEFNLSRRFAGNTDAALTDLGLLQAAATADYIASAYTVDAVYASDLQRAFCTGKAVADRLGLPVRPHKGLREIFAGEWEGQRFDHLEAAYPETFAGLWRKDIGNSVCDGGESVAQLMQRILATVREIAEADGVLPEDPEIGTGAGLCHYHRYSDHKHRAETVGIACQTV